MRLNGYRFTLALNHLEFSGGANGVQIRNIFDMIHQTSVSAEVLRKEQRRGKKRGTLLPYMQTIHLIPIARSLRKAVL